MGMASVTKDSCPEDAGPDIPSFSVGYLPFDARHLWRRASGIGKERIARLSRMK